MRTKRFVALAVSLTLLGAACGDDDDTTAGTTSTSPSTSATGPTTTTAATTTTTAPADVCTEERVGGEITMGVGALMAAGLDPTVMLGTGIAGATETAAIYDQLMRYNPETGEFTPHVAESLEANADATEWTLTLKPDITFGNGDPLTANDVKYHIERLAAASVAASGMAQEVESIEVVDDLTAVITTRLPWGGFPYFLAAEGGMIVNERVVTEKGDQFSRDPVGAGVGPYEVERFEPNVEIILRAKDDYWAGPVCVERLRFIQVQGGRGTYEAFTTGEMDVMFLSAADVIADAREDDVDSYSSVAAAGGGFLFNSGRGTDPLMADVRLRKAVAHALDLDLMNERVYGGNGTPNSGVTDERQPMYTGVEGPQYDPDEARRLVEEVKAETGWDGSVTITCGNTPEGVEQTVTSEALLEAVGFVVEVESLPSAQANQKILLEGNYQIGCGGVTIQSESPFRGLNQFISTSVRNRVGIADEALDAAIYKVYEARDVEETREAMTGVQEVWNEVVPAHNFWSTEWYIGYQPHVHGITMNREGAVLWHNAWVED